MFPDYGDDRPSWLATTKAMPKRGQATEAMSRRASQHGGSLFPRVTVNTL